MILKNLWYIKSKNKNKIFAVGGSYGANLLVNYLGTKNLKEKLIEYAISISNPFDFFLCNRIGEESKNIYEILVLKFYKRNYLPGIYHCNKYKKCSFFDEKKLQNAQKIIDFDKEFFTKFLGYKNTDEYYLYTQPHTIYKANGEFYYQIINSAYKQLLSLNKNEWIFVFIKTEISNTGSNAYVYINKDLNVIFKII